MDFVVCQGDVVFVHSVPLLDANLLGPGTRLSCHQLLQVPDGVVLAA